MKLSPLPTLRALVLLACGVSSIPLIPGATHTWSGKGADGFWSTAANWENNTPPVAHESPTGLIFPAAALRHTSTNNLLDLKVSALLLDGTAYSLRGTGVGTNITLLPGGFFGAISATGGAHVLESSLQLTLTATNLLSVGAGASLAIAGRIVGDGTLAKAAPGTVRLRAVVPNTFAGGVQVNGGTLELASGSWAIPGALWVGSPAGGDAVQVKWLAGDQLADAAPVTVYENGSLVMNAFQDQCGDLTLIGGSVNTGLGALSPSAITAQAPAGGGSTAGTFNGVLQLRTPGTNRISVEGTVTTLLQVNAEIRGGSAGSPAPLEKVGPGRLQLTASNSFVGSVRVSEGSLAPAHPAALGGVSLGTSVAAGAFLATDGVDLIAEPIQLEAGSQWLSTGIVSASGPVVLLGDAEFKVGDQAAHTLTLRGQLSGPGGFTKSGAGVLHLKGNVANSFAGVAAVTLGMLSLENGPGNSVPAIPGVLRIGSSASLVPRTVRLMGSGQFGPQSVLWCDSHGYFDLAGHDETVPRLVIVGGHVTNSMPATLTVQGPILCTNLLGATSITADLQLGAGSTQVYTEGGLHVTGAVTAPTGHVWTKVGNGALFLDGNSMLDAELHSSQGTVVVNGQLPATVIVVHPSAGLGGQGLVKTIRADGGEVEPEPGPAGLRATTVFGTGGGDFNFHLLAAGNYGRVVCQKAPSIPPNTALFTVLGNNYDPPSGQVFVVLQNDDLLPVSGTFKDIPEGRVLPMGLGRWFRISYVGGDGNDVTATRVDPPGPGHMETLTRIPGVVVHLQGTGTPGVWYLVESKNSMSPYVGWANLGFAIAGPDGSLHFDDTIGSGQTTQFYRLSPP